MQIKIMKYKLLICLLVAAQFAMAQQKFELKGKANGIKAGFIYLNYENAEGKPVRDSSGIEPGSNFLFTGNISGPTIAYLSYGKVRSVDDVNTMNFFLEPGKINIQLAKDKFKDAS